MMRIVEIFIITYVIIAIEDKKNSLSKETEEKVRHNSTW